ncbi:hypothetical protein [Gemmatimonas groenlandica]|uniref:Uncharacterized protein n=1 Tax=Gemmatimonas groenlandica TaxID=2732249 RepID=A0A6M4ISK7_9BACT|nr:hypothetical protein [Gemmatimonas groenlandica]QJR37155.1 hypothetical protein HKW67_17340 [Gemmatimonas groenlandica]
MRLFALLFAALSVSGCHSPTEVRLDDPIPASANDPAWMALGRVCTPDAPAAVLSAAQRATLPPFSHGDRRVIDDDWADAARVVPGGWGGGYNDNGTSTIFLVDPSQRDAAFAALATRQLLNAPLGVEKVRVRRGRWDFAQLTDWFSYVRGYLPRMTGFATADIQEAQNRLEYTVSTAADRAALEAALRPLELPCYLVAINPVPR